LSSLYRDTVFSHFSEVLRTLVYIRFCVYDIKIVKVHASVIPRLTRAMHQLCELMCETGVVWQSPGPNCNMGGPLMAPEAIYDGKTSHPDDY
jgi:hypothetical protein